MWLALAVALAAAAESYPAYCRVTATLNVRWGPGTEFSKMGKLYRDDQIVVNAVSEHGNREWGTIDYQQQTGYVAMQYVQYLQPVQQAATSSSSSSPARSDSGGGWFSSVSSFFEHLWTVAKWVLIILAVLFWQYLLELAIYAGFFAGAGALVFWMIGGSASTGANVGLVVALLVGLRKLADRLDVGGSEFLSWLFIMGYYVISFPFYWLNQLEHFLVEPWRYLFRSDWVPDGAKPTLRIVLEVLSVVMYIAITPLRLFNAFVYNILLHCVTGLYDLMFEVLSPCDPNEGAGNVWKWIVMFPWRLLKYPIYHGFLTIVESVVWTVVDIFIPARTLYHGTNLDACELIVRDPHRNHYLKDHSIWSAGTFMASTGQSHTWAGRGVYFAINRQLARGYSYSSAPVMIACRVSMGRVINYTLTPSWVYRQTGPGGNHDELNRFGERNGYTTGQWYNNRGHWEYCLFDWQNRYNHPWRIRPVYILNFNTGRAQHISGGVQHWLFDKAVIDDLADIFEEWME